jgi:hypothetical protein
VRFRAILIVSVVLALVGSVAIATAGGARASRLSYPDGVSGQPRSHALNTTIQKASKKKTTTKKKATAPNVTSVGTSSLGDTTPDPGLEDCSDYLQCTDIQPALPPAPSATDSGSTSDNSNPADSPNAVDCSQNDDDGC